MPKICYVPKKFTADHQEVIRQANTICAAYRAQGYDLTLRQLYYQFVSRGLIPNKDTEYKRLGSIINEARLAGELDWNFIVDRTRNLRGLSHWSDPGSIIGSAAYSFRLDKWRDQPFHPEVWIEKDALVGVIEGPCQDNDVPYFSCRGYASQSEVWGAAQRLDGYRKRGQTPVVIHLGDHDPSGKDMTRDIADRLELFTDHRLEVKRIALNWDQIEQYQPPPNPAKLTDSRATAYIAEYGDESWELDALEPTVIGDLIRDTIGAFRDDVLWNADSAEEQRHRDLIQAAADRWDEVVDFLDGSDA